MQMQGFPLPPSKSVQPLQVQGSLNAMDDLQCIHLLNGRIRTRSATTDTIMEILDLLRGGKLVVRRMSAFSLLNNGQLLSYAYSQKVEVLCAYHLGKTTPRGTTTLRRGPKGSWRAWRLGLIVHPAREACAAHRRIWDPRDPR